MGLRLETAGLLTTVQDLGRHGFQKDGVVVSGAMDKVALRIGNLLVDNPEQEAGLEITLAGPQILFEESMTIALTGADLSAKLNGEPVKLWRPAHVTKGSVLSFGAPALGCRAYLTVAGGFELPKVMGSQATYLRANIGGYQGRALQAGDVIPCRLAAPAPAGAADAVVQAPWAPDPQLYPAYEENPVIKVLRGPEFDLFTESSQTDFWNSRFQVSTKSDRMGYRLEGPVLFVESSAEMLSSAVTFGSIQVPGQGKPIVLLADHQTTGGYPRIGQVITADFPKLAQAAPGKELRFQEVTLEEAQLLYIHQEKNIAQLKRSLQLKKLN